MNEQHNTSMDSLVLLPDDLVTAIKTADPSIAQRLSQYHSQKHIDTLNAMAALDPNSGASFPIRYKYLVELKTAHSRAQQLWSN